MATYALYQFRTNHVLIGGMFGIAMIMVFGMWMVDELIEAIVITPAEDGEYGVKSIDSISSIVMAGFGIFLIARFFWLRSFMSIEPKHVRS